MSIEIDCGDNLIDPLDDRQVEWLMKQILIPDDLTVHSNEIGDEIGTITNLSCVRLI